MPAFVLEIQDSEGEGTPDGEPDDDEPVISLIGDNPLILNCLDPYVEPGATAFDAVDGPVAVIDDGEDAVDTDEPGLYIIAYTASDVYGNTEIVTRDVIVRSNCPDEEGEGGDEGEGEVDGEGESGEGEGEEEAFDQVFVSVSDGSDSTGNGTLGLPWQTIGYAFAQVAPFASADQPVEVVALSGSYPEVLDVPAFVTLRGVDHSGAFATIIAAPSSKLLNEFVVVEMGPFTTLQDIAIEIPLDSPPSRTAVRSNNNEVRIERVKIDGHLALQSVGLQILGTGSSASVILDSEVTRVFNGLRAIETNARFFRTTFSIIEGDGVTVFQGSDKGGGETPLLGDENRPGETGSNVFSNVDGFFVRNLDPEDTLAQFNDWGFATAEEIAPKMSGAVIFSPFLKSVGAFSSTALITVQDNAGAALSGVDVRVNPGGISAASTQTTGVYTLTAGDGRYTFRASKSGFESTTVVESLDQPLKEVGPIVLQPQATVAVAAHAADRNGDQAVDLGELLRVIQLYNAAIISCDPASEDGYKPGSSGGINCQRYSADYLPPAWTITLSEVLRMIQFFNTGGFTFCPGAGTEDGFCPGT